MKFILMLLIAIGVHAQTINSDVVKICIEGKVWYKMYQNALVPKLIYVNDKDVRNNMVPTKIYHQDCK